MLSVYCPAHGSTQSQISTLPTQCSKPGPHVYLPHPYTYLLTCSSPSFSTHGFQMLVSYEPRGVLETQQQPLFPQIFACGLLKGQQPPTQGRRTTGSAAYHGLRVQPAVCRWQCQGARGKLWRRRTPRRGATAADAATSVSSHRVRGLRQLGICARPSIGCLWVPESTAWERLPEPEGG